MKYKVSGVEIWHTKGMLYGKLENVFSVENMTHSERILQMKFCPLSGSYR